MNNKAPYLAAFRLNRGRINEIELGTKLGLSENETQYILAQLLAEHRIEYVCEGHSNYRLAQKQRKQ